MPKAFYTGETGIPPVDKTIKRLVDSAYNHHIERLMILGNFMLLCEINPDEVYKWFMEMYIDAYDWVMVPNVYGMSQFADGGFMSTKPYISSSNYVLKMSDYPKGEWTEVWNGLFWRFVYKHYEFFSSNPRTQFMAGNIRKMSKEKLDNHINIAEQFLEKLYA
jgi:deoxyribodipyrimidine photolyase-related protein